MGSLGQQLHFFFFPFMAHGHMIPTMEMAKLFASRGVKTTIVTTTVNARSISKSIQTCKHLGFEIDIRILRFPTAEVGLPEGCENFDFIVSNPEVDLHDKFFLAATMLQDQLEMLLFECHPDCLVADMFFPWATDAAAKFGIPRLVFHGFSFFALCAEECVRLYELDKNVSSDVEPFVIPNLPGEIRLTRKQLPEYSRQDQSKPELTKVLKAWKESELKSFGVIVNSFYELEPDYADFYTNELGRKAWHIGPVSLSNRAVEHKGKREKEAHECLKWLDSMKSDSVIYICFGTMTNFTTTQLKEIAVALEASGHPFIWVVRREKEIESDEEWLPRGFEERNEGKRLIIRGWAPQVLILEHKAVGGFVTHCGWNSTLEGISAGKRMVTWPVTSEQFYNEKLVTDVLKIGVSVGVKEWGKFHGDEIKSEDIENGIRRVMEGEEVVEMRSRARKLGKMAREAAENGGSSYSDLDALVDLIKRKK
ncbi:scopoletin glucosyltransferase-like [Euphorbia lathyris]|uniref:scopoletin glucosyltransferase-like n=1 Tax=Euphorbia lathyris TaxID=212925 RepID=UPI003313E9B5